MRVIWAGCNSCGQVTITVVLSDSRSACVQAVEAVLNDYDWVFYLDADAWITNPAIQLESILPRQITTDLIVTEDATGANAGSWIIRNSDWSRQFLKEWWSLDSFIRVCALLIHTI